MKELEVFEKDGRWHFVGNRLKRSAELERDVLLPILVGLRPGTQNDPVTPSLDSYLPYSSFTLTQIARANQQEAYDKTEIANSRRAYRQLAAAWDEEHPRGLRMTLAEGIKWVDGLITIPWLLDAIAAGLVQRTNRSSSKAANEFKKWLVEEMSNNRDEPRAKRMVVREATKMFPGLGAVEFNKVWTAAAKIANAPEWSKAGPRKSSRVNSNQKRLKR